MKHLVHHQIEIVLKYSSILAAKPFVLACFNTLYLLLEEERLFIKFRQYLGSDEQHEYITSNYVTRNLNWFLGTLMFKNQTIQNWGFSRPGLDKA